MAYLRPLSKITISLAALVFAAGTSLDAQSPLPQPNGAAKLLTFTGQISVIHVGGPDAWALNVNDAIKPLEVVVTGPDGWGIFQVADGSKFEVYPNSRVVFRANRGDWRDLLEVWLGKVRVQIEHLGGVPNDNKVRTPTAVISVRGTIFIVEVQADTHATLVQDEEGVVVVRHTLRPSERILNTGEYVWVFENEALGKAMFDRGGLMQRVARAAQDAFYQAAVNGRGTAIPKGVGTATSGGASPGDKNGGTTAPPPPAPTAPPPPPH